MPLSPAGLLASACLGVTVLAESGAAALPWGLRSSYDSISFALYETSLAAVGALVVTARRATRSVGSSAFSRCSRR